MKNTNKKKTNILDNGFGFSVSPIYFYHLHNNNIFINGVVVVGYLVCGKSRSAPDEQVSCPLVMPAASRIGHDAAHESIVVEIDKHAAPQQPAGLIQAQLMRFGSIRRRDRLPDAACGYCN